MEETDLGTDKQNRVWAMIAHVGPLIVSFLSGGLLSFAVPLAIYFAKQGEDEFVVDQAKESLNFRITIFLAYIVLTPLVIILILTGIGICIAIPILGIAYLFELVVSVVAGIRAMDGHRFRYPIAIRFIR